MINLGRSGCKIVLDNNVITKFSSSVSYNNRLLEQYNRQSNFRGQFFYTPKVFDFVDSEVLYNFKMHYVHHKNFNQFCNEGSVGEIGKLFECIVSFIDHNFDCSYSTSISEKILADKINSLYTKNEEPYIKFLIENMICKIPIGYCHGDFTISNMLLSSEFYLIDFLDNIFDSPLFDLVKIRQDTYHKLYFMLSKYDYRSNICLDKLDKLLLSKFEEQIHSHEYNCLAILNLLRMLPYMKKEKESTRIRQELKKYETYIASRRKVN